MRGEKKILLFPLRSMKVIVLRFSLNRKANEHQIKKNVRGKRLLQVHWEQVVLKFYSALRKQQNIEEQQIDVSFVFQAGE